MKIADVQLYKYSIPFVKTLMFNHRYIHNRQGFIIKITGDNGFTGISEISPLPSFSRESLNDALVQIKTFRKDFIYQNIPQDILSYTEDLYPSVQFGIESSLLNLTASTKQLSLADLLNPNAGSVIPVNALLTGSIDEIIIRAENLYESGFRIFKLKVGRVPVSEEITIVKLLRETIGEDSVIRLDANRSFEYNVGVRFLDQIAQHDIEYVEEPFKTFSECKRYLQQDNQPVPLAFDETLQEISPRQLNQYPKLNAIILKPTLLGYTYVMAYARMALRQHIKPVISSSFESSVGIYILASMAAVIDSTIPVGLDTLGWFAHCLTENKIVIKNGQIDLADYDTLMSQIDYSLLKEIDLD